MMYYRISKNEKNLFFGKKIAQVWAVTLNGLKGLPVAVINVNVKLGFCHDNWTFYIASPQGLMMVQHKLDKVHLLFLLKTFFLIDTNNAIQLVLSLFQQTCCLSIPRVLLWI